MVSRASPPGAPSVTQTTSSGFRSEFWRHRASQSRLSTLTTRLAAFSGLPAAPVRSRVAAGSSGPGSAGRIGPSQPAAHIVADARVTAAREMISSSGKPARARRPAVTHRSEGGQSAEADSGQELLGLLLRRDVVPDGLCARASRLDSRGAKVGGCRGWPPGSGTHARVEEEDLIDRSASGSAGTATRQRRENQERTEMPSVSNRVAAVATRETISLASSMRDPFSSKAVGPQRSQGVPPCKKPGHRTPPPTSSG